jgi:Protein of unknown function (DUF3800)
MRQEYVGRCVVELGVMGGMLFRRLAQEPLEITFADCDVDAEDALPVKLRLGVPARVVVDYHGGEGKPLILRLILFRVVEEERVAPGGLGRAVLTARGEGHHSGQSADVFDDLCLGHLTMILGTLVTDMIMPSGFPEERHIEIACDESGFSGGNLVGGGHSPVFAHASVHIEPETAGELIQHLRREIGARGDGEYKSPEILRPRRRPVVLWLLGTSSPIYGNAHVHLTNTRFFVLARMVDVLLSGHPVRGIACPGTNPDTRPMALALYRSGEQSYGAARWQDFLRLSANLFRINNRWLPKAPVELFYAAVEAMAQTDADDEVSQIISLLKSTRPVAEATRTSHLQNPKLTPLMEPLLPALNRTVHHWGVHAATLSVIHDEQSALTPERIADIATAFAARYPGHQLTEVRLVDSSREARVQIADFVAGIARRLAADELEGGADPEIMALLGPLIDHESVWGDRTASAM